MSRAGLTAAQRAEAAETLKRLDALLMLAAANFPACTDIRIETAGCNPRASISIPYYRLAALLDARRASSTLAAIKGETT